jgi:glycosyltransferase involved in cell wall biosynthesis
VRELIEDGSTGLLCQPDSPLAWRAAIQTLIDSPRMADDLGERARRVFLGRHTWLQRARLVLE